jgi:hypothetical protein
MSAKERKARWSKALRASCVVLATLGGVVPATALATGHAELGNWGFIIFAATVNNVISSETESWVAEFAKHLSEAGKADAPHV